MNQTDLEQTALIEEFLEYKRVDCGLNLKTLQAYRLDLLQFLNWLIPSTSLRTVQESHLTEYLQDLARHQIQPISRARKISSLRQFYSFCCREKNLENNPAEWIDPPRTPDRLPRFLQMEEVKRLLDAVDQGLPYLGRDEEALRARDRAWVYLLYATGMRISEIVSLTLGQLEISMNYVRVQGKRGQERIAPYVPQSGEKLVDYIQNYRAKLLKPSHEPGEIETDVLFLNTQGTQLSRQACWKILKALSVQAEISTEISPHLLRHSFATHLLHSGIPLRTLQMLLGHADISSTQIYTHLTPQDLKKAHQKYHPRGR